MMELALISLGAVNLVLLALLFARRREPAPELREISERLDRLHETAGAVAEMSRGLQDLQSMFADPNGRGAFGEFTLERLLADLFGDATELYALQHTLPDGERVDAAIFVRPDRAQFVAVDSKFPAEHGDVRARAREIASKYIRPPLTLDFAFMFVPSESRYARILEDAKLHEDLLRMHVIPTSPNSFYAYLQSMAAAFQGMKIERKSVEIQRAVIQLAKDYARFLGHYTRLGEKLEQASKTYRESIRAAERLTHRFESLQAGEVRQEVESSDPSGLGR